MKFNNLAYWTSQIVDARSALVGLVVDGLPSPAAGVNLLTQDGVNVPSWTAMPVGTQMSSMPFWLKYVKQYSDFSIGGLTSTITLATLPAGYVVHACKIDHTVAFGGGIVATAILKGFVSLDQSTSLLDLTSRNVFLSPGAVPTMSVATPYCASDTAVSYFCATLTTTVGLINALTAGAATLWLQVSNPG